MYASSQTTGTIQVTTEDPAESYTAAVTQGLDWVTLTSGTNYQGTQTITFRIEANGTTAQRIAEIVVAGQAFRITQLGRQALTLEPSHVYLTSGYAATFSAKVNGVDANSIVQWGLTGDNGVNLGLLNAGSYIAPAEVANERDVYVSATLPDQSEMRQSTVHLQPYHPPSGQRALELYIPEQNGRRLKFHAHLLTGSSQVDIYEANPVEFLFKATPTTPASFPGAAPFVNACHVRWFFRSSNVYLLKDDGITPSAISFPGAPVVLENSQCRIHLKTSAIQVFGSSTVDFFLDVEFKAPFAGTKDSWVQLTKTVDGISSIDFPWTNLKQFGVPGYGTPNISLTNPKSVSQVSGNVSINGWALDNTAGAETAISAVEVLIDGRKVGVATYGFPSDACNTYPNRPGCPNVRFEFTWDSTTVENGPHIIQVKAIDSDPIPQASTVEVVVDVQNTPSVPHRPSQSHRSPDQGSHQRSARSTEISMELKTLQGRS